MLTYNEITPKSRIILSGEPYEVLEAHVFRKQQRKPVNQTKLRNLTTGKVTEYSFQQSDNVEEALVERMPIIFLYTNKGEYWFHAEGDPKNRFALPEEILGTSSKFLKEKMPVEALVFQERTIGIELPIKMEVTVADAPPAVRGNTAQGGTKQVVLETGATITTPMFINTGDTIRINTETGEYVERVQKSSL